MNRNTVAYFHTEVVEVFKTQEGVHAVTLGSAKSHGEDWRDGLGAA